VKKQDSVITSQHLEIKKLRSETPIRDLIREIIK
jgi:hypothetical protein